MPDILGLFTLGGIPDYWDTIVQVLVSNFTTTSSSLVNITGLRSTADINSLYEIEVVIKGRSNDTSGTQFSVACSAAGSTGEYMCISQTGTASSGARFEVNALGIANGTNKITTANTDGIAILKAVVSTSATTGNLTVQCLHPGGVNTSTIYVGSIMKIKKLA